MQKNQRTKARKATNKIKKGGFVNAVVQANEEKRIEILMHAKKGNEESKSKFCHRMLFILRHGK